MELQKKFVDMEFLLQVILLSAEAVIPPQNKIDFHISPEITNK